MLKNDLGIPTAAVFDSQDYNGDPDSAETVVRGGQVWPRYIFNRDGSLCDLKTSRFVPKKTDPSITLVFPEETNVEMVREHLGVIDF